MHCQIKSPQLIKPIIGFIQLYQVRENQILYKLMQVVEKTSIKLVGTTTLYNQLTSNLLITCIKIVIIKPKQAMRTHPGIRFMTARQQVHEKDLSQRSCLRV